MKQAISPFLTCLITFDCQHMKPSFKTPMRFNITCFTDSSSPTKMRREQPNYIPALPYTDDFIHTHVSTRNLCQRQLHSSLKGTTWGNTLGLTQLVKTEPRTYSEHILRQRFERTGSSTGVNRAGNFSFEVSIRCVIPDDRIWFWPNRGVIGV